MSTGGTEPGGDGVGRSGEPAPTTDECVRCGATEAKHHTFYGYGCDRYVPPAVPTQPTKGSTK